MDAYSASSSSAFPTAPPSGPRFRGAGSPAGAGASFGTPSSWSLDDLKDATNLDAAAQTHLAGVYQTLAGLFAVSGLGAWLHAARFVSGGLWSSLVLMGCLVGFSLTPPTAANRTLRGGLVAAFAACQGVSLGPLLEQVAVLHPGLVTTALGATSLVFVCFSLAAVYSQGSRLSLMLGGLLGSAMGLLFWLNLASLFLGPAVYSAQLYLGLLVFAGFVVFDTQMIIAKTKAGSRDTLGHAMTLYVDAVALFVRVLLILKQKAEADERRKDKRRR